MDKAKLYLLCAIVLLFTLVFFHSNVVAQCDLGKRDCCENGAWVDEGDRCTWYCDCGYSGSISVTRNHSVKEEPVAEYEQIIEGHATMTLVEETSPTDPISGTQHKPSPEKVLRIHTASHAIAFSDLSKKQKEALLNLAELSSIEFVSTTLPAFQMRFSDNNFETDTSPNRIYCWLNLF